MAAAAAAVKAPLNSDELDMLASDEATELDSVEKWLCELWCEEGADRRLVPWPESDDTHESRYWLDERFSITSCAAAGDA